MTHTPTSARGRFWRTPLDIAQWEVRPGRVTVLSERCKGCEWCVAYCPAGVLAMSEAFNDKGHHYPLIVSAKADSCVSCGYCEAVCPDFAIFVESSSEREEV